MNKENPRSKALVKEYGKILSTVYKLKIKQKYYKACKFLYHASIIDAELGRPKNKGDIISQIKELEKNYKHTFPHHKKERELKDNIYNHSEKAKESMKKGYLNQAVMNYEQCAIYSSQIGDFVKATDYGNKIDILKEKLRENRMESLNKG